MSDSFPPGPPEPPPAPGVPPAPPAVSAAPVQGWQAPGPARTPSDAIPIGALIVSLLPIGLVALLAVIAPSFLAPLLDDAMPILGLPPIAAFFGALAVLFAVNLLAARAIRNPFLLGLVLAMTTTAALFVVILAPAVIIILVNLEGLPID